MPPKRKITPVPDARKRNALGRGLSALMSSSVVKVEKAKPTPKKATRTIPASPPTRKPETAFTKRAKDPSVLTETPAPSLEGLLYLKLAQLVPNEKQPRQHFPEAELQSLAQSIKDTGLLQPIIVRPKKNEISGSPLFEIIAGERRYRASQIAGLSEIPALVREVSDREALALGIIENVQRSDLNPIEEAFAYRRLIDDFNETQEQVATSVGRDRASIANSLRLLKLPTEVQEMLKHGQLSAGHGRALLMLGDTSAQLRLAEKSIKEGLSVRALEKLTSPTSQQEKSANHTSTAPKTEKSPGVLEIEDRFRRALGTKVGLVLHEHGGGSLTISFFSQAELESLLDILHA